MDVEVECGMTVDQAMTMFETMGPMRANAVYSDGRRQRLGRARLVTALGSNVTRVEWGGVKVKRRGTVIAVAVGHAVVSIIPRDVRAGMTFSASARVEDLGHGATPGPTTP